VIFSPGRFVKRMNKLLRGLSVKKKRLHTQICTCGPKFAGYEERHGYLYV
jgi:hypothetical protein